MWRFNTWTGSIEWIKARREEDVLDVFQRIWGKLSVWGLEACRRGREKPTSLVFVLSWRFVFVVFLMCDCSLKFSLKVQNYFLLCSFNTCIIYKKSSCPLTYLSCIRQLWWFTWFFMRMWEWGCCAGKIWEIGELLKNKPEGRECWIVDNDNNWRL